MAAARYAYTGTAEMWYQDYLDDDTGKMLIAVPGGAYAMSPVNLALPVPPSDSRWIAEVPVVTTTWTSPVSVPVSALAPAAPVSSGGEN